MLLLYRPSSDPMRKMQYIYIPLCFYFISWPFHQVRICSSFTFHYASTLSPMSMVIIRPQCHLHSTMLLLYQREIAVHVDGVIIYIPLCFYFILVRTTQCGDIRNNLHSTMLLLYPASSARLDAVYNIYIPLCFYFILVWCKCQRISCSDLHSTMLLLYRVPVCIQFVFVYIYIPLCFYFIENGRSHTGYNL